CFQGDPSFETPPHHPNDVPTSASVPPPCHSNCSISPKLCFHAGPDLYKSRVSTSLRCRDLTGHVQLNEFHRLDLQTRKVGLIDGIALHQIDNQFGPSPNIKKKKGF